MSNENLNIRGGTSLPESMEENELFLLFDDVTNAFKQVYTGSIGGGTPISLTVQPVYESILELITTGGIDENDIAVDIVEAALGIRIYENGFNATKDNSASIITNIKEIMGDPYVPQLGDHVNTLLSKTDSGDIRIDENTFPEGAILVFEHNVQDLGDISIIGGTNVTLNTFAGNNRLTGRYATASVIHKGNNHWLLTGNLIS